MFLSAKNLPFTRVQVIALVLIEKGMAVAGLKANVQLKRLCYKDCVLQLQIKLDIPGYHGRF